MLEREVSERLGSAKRIPRRRLRAWLAVMATTIVAVLAVVLRLFVWPPVDVVGHADAVVVLGGSGERTQRGLALAREGLAPVLVVSVSGAGDRRCVRFVPRGVELACFRPTPFTTQGEAQAVSALARSRGWHRLIVIAGEEQMPRARLRLERCYSARLVVVGVRVAWYEVPWKVGYETSALVKALLIQRSC